MDKDWKQATNQGDLEKVRSLLESGADLNMRSTRSFLGKTALALAEEGGLSEITALLEQKGATR